jgi:hypothetical protein
MTRLEPLVVVGSGGGSGGPRACLEPCSSRPHLHWHPLPSPSNSAIVGVGACHPVGVGVGGGDLDMRSL